MMALGLSSFEGADEADVSQFLGRRTARAFRLACFCIPMCVSGFGVDPAAAQTLGTSDIQSILQGVTQGTTTPTPPQQSTSSTPLSSSSQTLQPATNPPATAQSAIPSALENDFSTRAGVTLKQFGYDFFGMSSSVTATQVGAVQDSYISASATSCRSSWSATRTRPIRSASTATAASCS